MFSLGGLLAPGWGSCYPIGGKMAPFYDFQFCALKTKFANVLIYFSVYHIAKLICKENVYKSDIFFRH